MWSPRDVTGPTDRPTRVNHHLNDYSAHFASPYLALVPDHDEPGRRHAQTVTPAVADPVAMTRLFRPLSEETFGPDGRLLHRNRHASSIRETRHRSRRSSSWLIAT